VHPGHEEFMMMSRWFDHAALREWTGRDENVLPLLPNIADLATEWTVQHFEELDADEDAGRAARKA
jgi:hypothetical protein